MLIHAICAGFSMSKFMTIVLVKAKNLRDVDLIFVTKRLLVDLHVDEVKQALESYFNLFDLTHTQRHICCHLSR